MNDPGSYKVIVIGVSAGGLNFIKTLLKSLPADFSMAVIIVQHVRDSSNDTWAKLLDEQCDIHVKEADEKEPILSGCVYIAPANYHLLIEQDRSLTLTLEGHVNYARPSIDVLFETAADVYGSEVVGVIGTGANSDGALGLKSIKQAGGLTIVQDPESAEVPAMPKSAIKTSDPDTILHLQDIINKILSIHENQLRI